MILNSVFKDTVTVNKSEEFVNCEFSGGSVPKQKGVYGVSINGDADVSIRDCKFANKGYSAVMLNSAGNIAIDNCEFDCTGMYNPIEGNAGTGGAALTSVNINDVVMSGICGNNYINVYHFADNAVVNINDVKVVGMSQQAEVVRVSNLNSNPATINVTNLSYAYDMSTQFDEKWTATFLFQDYSKDKSQNFKNISLNVNGMTVNGKKVTDKDQLPVGKFMAICDVNLDTVSDNDPAVSFTA